MSTLHEHGNIQLHSCVQVDCLAGCLIQPPCVAPKMVHMPMSCHSRVMFLDGRLHQSRASMNTPLQPVQEVNKTTDRDFRSASIHGVMFMMKFCFR